jgi:orotate phosphoribosyltransferase
LLRVDLDAEFDVLFGPAYKGIPLVVLAAAALAEHHDLDYPFAFNRKEAKDHGEGGAIVGASVSGKKVLIVDDVITAGTAIKEVASLITEAGGTPVGVLVALDREEIGTRARIPARDQLEAEIGLRIMNIVSLTDFVEHLEESEDYAAHLPALKAYRNRYGVALED